MKISDLLKLLEWTIAKAHGTHWISDKLEFSLAVKHRLRSTVCCSYLPGNILASYM